jgi:hypothetical protein
VELKLSGSELPQRLQAVGGPGCRQAGLGWYVLTLSTISLCIGLTASAIVSSAVPAPLGQAVSSPSAVPGPLGQAASSSAIHGPHGRVASFFIFLYTHSHWSSVTGCRWWPGDSKAWRLPSFSDSYFLSNFASTLPGCG